MDWDPLRPGVPGADEDDCWGRTWADELAVESSPAGPEGEEPAGADWSPGDRSNPKRRRAEEAEEAEEINTELAHCKNPKP